MTIQPPLGIEPRTSCIGYGTHSPALKLNTPGVTFLCILIKLLLVPSTITMWLPLRCHCSKYGYLESSATCSLIFFVARTNSYCLSYRVDFFVHSCLIQVKLQLLVGPVLWRYCVETTVFLLQNVCPLFIPS